MAVAASSTHLAGPKPARTLAHRPPGLPGTIQTGELGHEHFGGQAVELLWRPDLERPASVDDGQLVGGPHPARKVACAAAGPRLPRVHHGVPALHLAGPSPRVEARGPEDRSTPASARARAPAVPSPGHRRQLLRVPPGWASM